MKNPMIGLELKMNKFEPYWSDDGLIDVTQGDEPDDYEGK